MPELPEVETVRRALTPFMEGAQFLKVVQNRRNLRFDFPDNFSKRLEGQRVEVLHRRGKYMIAEISSGESLIMHLGMSGRFTVREEAMETPQTPAPKAALTETTFYYGGGTKAAHDHAIFTMALPLSPQSQGKTPANQSGKTKSVQIVYNDPRRFGFMDLVDSAKIEECRHFAAMGPEPLGNGFHADALYEGLKGRKAPIKQALLDQRVVAGLGNIYVCEALFRSGISPKRQAGKIAQNRIEVLTTQIRHVLQEAIEAGGSSLRDFASTDGSPGYFQHDFQIYGREGQACRNCARPIVRIVQGGRSTFYCNQCQR